MASSQVMATSGGGLVWGCSVLIPYFLALVSPMCVLMIWSGLMGVLLFVLGGLFVLAVMVCFPPLGLLCTCIGVLATFGLIYVEFLGAGASVVSCGGMGVVPICVGVGVGFGLASRRFGFP